jgi:hypothetical protein
METKIPHLFKIVFNIIRPRVNVYIEVGKLYEHPNWPLWKYSKIP